MPFPVVGIGASGGGLPALVRLLERMPPAPGMALVAVLYLAPDASGQAERALRRATAMPVLGVSERVRLLPDRVYLISPGRSLRIEDGHLVAGEPACALGIPMTVNVFFRTLAEAYGELAVGVVLSGAGSDGAAGLAHVKAHGGVTIAQLPGDAEQRGMPQAAIDSGMVDVVLRAAQIPARLAEERAAMRIRGRRRARGAGRFFRDRAAFDALEQTILPRVFHERRPDQPPRAWVAACGTGEDAYSLGMLLAERAGSDDGVPAMQIFATDADEGAIAVARIGRYPAAIAADVAPGRLDRFFVPDGDHVKVRRLLRDRILFAHHDVLHDPAFAHLDLIICRDVLAGLDHGTRRHLLEIFRQALKPGGCLFLGDADSADGAPDLFSAVDARHRLYQALPSTRPPGHCPPRLVPREGEPRAGAAARHEAAAPSVAELHQRALARLAPPSLLLNERAEVVHVDERAACFLGYGGGEPSTQVLALVLPALRETLRTLLANAAASGSPARSGPVRCDEGGRAQRIGLSVLPVPAPSAGGADWMLVQFEAVTASAASPSGPAEPQVQALEDALLQARNDLQRTIERAETAGEVLRATNGRLQDTVDGLRAEIEDLELDREEMQSRNEELDTVNAELQIRLDEIAKANDDLRNLIASTDIATLFLGQRMQIQRYTPHVTRIFNIIPADVGRPLAHISNRLESTRLLEDVAGVFTSQQPIERELRSTDGHDYIVRMHPYRTAYERVEGVVITFFDITRRRSAERALQESARRQAFLLALADAIRGEHGAEAVAERALRLLAAELGLDRCCVLAWTPDADRAEVTQQAGNERVPALPAAFRLSDAPPVLRAPPARTLAADDLQDGPPGMRALVAATLRSGEGEGGGPWSMLAISATPRRWTRHEIALVEEAAERAWSAIGRIRAEATAARAERRAESILERMGDAHSVLDRDYRIVGVNAAAERLLGRARATLLGRSHWEAFPASVDAPVGRAFRRVVEEGIEQHLAHHYTGEGYDMYLEVDAYPTDEGGVAMFWRDVTERVRAEQALRASEEQYRALFNEMDEAYAVVEVMADAGGRWHDFLFIEVNPAFMRHTGMPYPVGRTAIQLLGTPNPRWAELYGRAAETGVPIRVEEGEMTLGRVFDLNIFRLGDEGSRRVAVLFTDITERKNAEAALRESERRYRLLFETMGEGFTLAELIRDGAGRPVDWRYLEVNAAWAQTGVPPAQALGRTAREVNPAIEPYWIETYGRVVDSGEPVNFEAWAAGFGKWFDTVAFKHSENRFGVLFRDVTARREADAALRASELRYRALFESIDEGFVVAEVLYDEQGRAVDALYLESNPAASRLTGVPDFVNRRFSDLMPGAESYWLEIYDRVVRSGTPERLERYAAPLGRWYDFHVSRAADGDLARGPAAASGPAPEGIYRVAVVFQDITARKRADEALKAADRRKDEFLATLAHELRNPLAPISNALQFLRYPQGKRRADRLLAMVERQVRHMVRLVDDLMEVSRISRGKVDLRRAPVALADIVNTAVEASLPGFEQKEQRLTVQPVDGSLRLDADKVRLTQVFANLLNNAAKYTPAGGQAWLAVRREGRQAVVSVRDTGMGMGGEQLPLVFEMFSQPHGRNDHTDSGLGIGLAMVRSLVHLHGGSVEAHSDGPGTGSEFVVRLPLADCPDAALATADGPFADGPFDPGAALLAGKRILVVDDNRDAADSLCQLLAARGADVSAAYDGRAAIDALAGTPPHAIVLDIGMPGMDGYEVARRIRQDGRADGIRLVALSGWGQQADRQRSRASGFDYHLTKPAEVDSLIRILAAS